MKRFLLGLLLAAGQCFGQTHVSGVVKDEQGNAIPGANVSVKGTYDGASTDLNGNFEFSTTESGQQILLVTFVGFTSTERPLVLDGAPLTIALVLRESINQLNAVTISAGSFTAGEEKQRTILKAVDIATTAGATADIAGALNTLPGTTKVGETGRLFVRGGDGSETRTFIDGMVVLDAYSPSAPNTPARGRFMPFMFKGTSFSTGGYSAEYGQALSSALVLSSKDKAEMNQTDMSIMTAVVDVAHTQVWEEGSATAKVQYTNLKPYFNLINQYVDWHTAPSAFETSGALRQKIGQDGQLKFYGIYDQSSYAMYQHAVAKPELKSLLELTNTYAYGNGTYRQSISESSTLRGGVSYNYTDNAYALGGIPSHERENGLHGKLVAESSLSDHAEVRVGMEAVVRNYVATTGKADSLLTASFREAITVAFAEGELYASSKFVTKAGLRLEHNSMRSATTVDPRVSMAYKPGNLGQFSFAYGWFRQSPSNSYLRMNPLLDPERAEHFILNYQFITDRRTFRVEMYHKNYDNLVKYPDGNVLHSDNSGSGYARGVEFFWRDNASIRNVDYWVSYSFLDTKRDYLNFPSGAVPSFASTHNFSIVYKHFVTAIKSQLGLTYSYTSGRPYLNPNHDNFNSDRTPSYQDLSFNIAYLPKHWLIVYFSCTNLLGRDNIFGYRFAASPGPDGIYASEPVRQPASRFLILGLLITISKNKSVNQLPNL